MSPNQKEEPRCCSPSSPSSSHRESFRARSFLKLKCGISPPPPPRSGDLQSGGGSLSSRPATLGRYAEKQIVPRNLGRTVDPSAGNVWGRCGGIWVWITWKGIGRGKTNSELGDNGGLRAESCRCAHGLPRGIGPRWRARPSRLCCGGSSGAASKRCWKPPPPCLKVSPTQRVWAPWRKLSCAARKAGRETLAEPARENARPPTLRPSGDGHQALESLDGNHESTSYQAPKLSALRGHLWRYFPEGRILGVPEVGRKFGAELDPEPALGSGTEKPLESGAVKWTECGPETGPNKWYCGRR